MLRLPVAAYAKVADAVQTDKLGEAVAYYKAFSRYAHGTPDAEEMLPTLAEVRTPRLAGRGLGHE
eukprot:357937-Chlamydomonas_euryale.AAC.5